MSIAGSSVVAEDGVCYAPRMSMARTMAKRLKIKNVKVAYAMEHLLKVAGSMENLKANFPAIFEQTFIQREKEVYAPATSD